MANEDQKPAEQVDEAVQEAQVEDTGAVEIEEIVTIDSLQAELDEANQTIAELQKQLAELEPRAQAEIANQRRRAGG